MMSAQPYPQTTYDASNNFGQDLELSARNDLLNVSGVERSNQRILRRLLTNNGDYIWHTEYGAGLPSFVGKGLTNEVYAQIQSLIISQIYFEDTVAKTPVPQITIVTIQGGLL